MQTVLKGLNYFTWKPVFKTSSGVAMSCTILILTKHWWLPKACHCLNRQERVHCTQRICPCCQCLYTVRVFIIIRLPDKKISCDQFVCQNRKIFCGNIEFKCYNLWHWFCPSLLWLIVEPVSNLRRSVCVSKDDDF